MAIFSSFLKVASPLLHS